MDREHNNHQNLPFEQVLEMVDTLPMSFEGGPGSDISIQLVEIHFERLIVNYRFHLFMQGDVEDYAGKNPVLDVTEFPPEFSLPADPALLEIIKNQMIAKVRCL